MDAGDAVNILNGCLDSLTGIYNKYPHTMHSSSHCTGYQNLLRLDYVHRDISAGNMVLRNISRAEGFSELESALTQLWVILQNKHLFLDGPL